MIGLLVTVFVTAQTNYTWNGSVSTAWNTAANWTPNAVPTATDNIIVNSNSVPNYPVLDQNRTVANITISADTLDLGGYTLTMTGSNESFIGGRMLNGLLKITNANTSIQNTACNADVEITTGEIYITNSTFLGSLVLVKNGTTTDYLQYSTFNNLDIRLTAGTINLDANTHDGNIVVSNTGTGMIFWGSAPNIATTSKLASSKTITIGSNGFSSGVLALWKFEQLGSTAQNLTVTGTATLGFGMNSTWNGNLTAQGNSQVTIYNEGNSSTFNGTVSLTAPNLEVRRSTFNGNATFNKTGNATNTWMGGNTFNANCTVNSSGAGGLLLNNGTSSTPVIYNGDLTVNQTGTGFVNNGNGTGSVTRIRGNVTHNCSVAGGWGWNGGVLHIDGTGNQTFNVTGSLVPWLGNVIVNKTSGTFTLSGNHADVHNSLTLTAGKVITSTNAMLRVLNNATSNATNGFVEGPMSKAGTQAFTFPTGANGRLTPISISAPSTNSTFVASYSDITQNIGASKEASVDSVDFPGFWSLSRAAGTANVNVSLRWNLINANIPPWVICNLIGAARVVGWNGNTWKDLGSANVSGNDSLGNITTSVLPTTFSHFTIAKRCMPSGGVVNISPNSNPVVLCAGNSVTLTATGGRCYKWYRPFVSYTNPLTINTPGVYHLKSITNAGVVEYDSVVVQLNPAIIVNAAPVDTIYAVQGNQVTLGSTPTAQGGTGTLTYSWSPSSNLSSNTSSNPTLNVETDATYSVIVTDSRQCSSTDVVRVMMPPNSADGLDISTSGCPGSDITICFKNLREFVGKKIVFNNIITNCPSEILITNTSDCYECTIVSLGGNPSITIVDPNTGMVYNDNIVSIN